MKKQVKAVFKLTDEEIKEAFYDFYVMKLKENKINCMFSKQEIDIEFTDRLEISLTIYEEKEI